MTGQPDGSAERPRGRPAAPAGRRQPDGAAERPRGRPAPPALALAGRRQLDSSAERPRGRPAAPALALAALLAPACQLPPEEPRVALPPSAHEVLSERCDRGDGPACVDVAAQFRELGDLGRAAAYSRRACDLASPFGCAALARAWERGEGVERDPAAATSLYISACLGGHASSCISAAAGLPEPDAAEFMRRGCTAQPALCPPRPEPAYPGVDPLDQANVVAAMTYRRDDVGACYRRSLAQHLTLRGRVALEIAISGDGRPLAVAIVENIREAPEVGACVAEVAVGAPFGPTASGEVAIVPWRVMLEPL